MTPTTRHRFEQAANGPARPYQETLAIAQEQVAARLHAHLREDMVDARTLAHWLANESALCRINALALDALAGWYAAQPAVLPVISHWADELRRDAQLAGDDVRGLGNIAGPEAAVLFEWQAFQRFACGSLRAGEALGAALLPGRVLRGPVREAVARVIELPAASGATRYLRRRLLPDAMATHDARAGLLNLYARTSLGAGAQRAAAWYLALLDGVFVRDCAPAE